MRWHSPQSRRGSEAVMPEEVSWASSAPSGDHVASVDKIDYLRGGEDVLCRKRVRVNSGVGSLAQVSSPEGWTGSLQTEVCLSHTEQRPPTGVVAPKVLRRSCALGV